MTRTPDPESPVAGHGIGHFLGMRSMRNPDDSVSSWVTPRPSLAGAGGGVRLGITTYLTDVATGITSGLPVLSRGEWVVTTDLSVTLSGAVTVGPMRIDARAVRVGTTTVVASFDIVDESIVDGSPVVGGGTSTSRPFPFEFERDITQFPVGELLAHDGWDDPPDHSLLEEIDGHVRRSGAASSITIELVERLRNPWGILHGGVTASLVDLAVEALVPDQRAVSLTLRYLAPGRVGPIIATAVPGSRAGESGRRVRVEVIDAGHDGRVVGLADVVVL